MNPTSNQTNTPEGYSGPALGQPIGGGGHSSLPSSTLNSSSTTTGGSAALAAGSAGDYTPNPFGSTVQHSGEHSSSSHSHPHSSATDSAALRGALEGSGGEGRDTSYETTHPQSGFQAQGEAQPHVAGRGGAGAAGLTGAAIGSGAGEFASHGHSAENSSRRDDGLINKVEHGATGQHTSAQTFTGKDASSAFVDGHTGPHSSGAGVAGLTGAGVGGAGLAGAAGAAAHHGQHSGEGHHSGVNPNTKNDTHGGPEDLTIGGFNPKVAASGIDPAVPKAKEVEHISTDGPHGLVFDEATQKYVHRRELDGKH